MSVHFSSHILTGDSLDVLKTLDNNSIDSVITDPPYGYSFMGKDWDKAVPSVDIWRECLRVLKPGAFCMVMSAPRSDVQNAMISRLMEAGFRLDFTPIYWTYASGFPKAGDTAKLVDKRLGMEPTVVGTQKLQGTARRMKGGNFGDFGGEDTADVINLTEPVSDLAKSLKGSKLGFQPKPAVEVIIVAMKPLSEKTYVDQAMKNGHGVTWLDEFAWRNGENYVGNNIETQAPGNKIGANPNKQVAPTKNHHPTVKPLKLMSYLITLTSRPGDVVLDPFVGSGTTVIAAEQLGRIGIGIEREPEYAEIAQARLSHVKIEHLPQLPKEEPIPTDETLDPIKVEQARLF